MSNKLDKVIVVKLGGAIFGSHDSHRRQTVSQTPPIRAAKPPVHTPVQ